MITGLSEQEFRDWLFARVTRRQALDLAVPEQAALYEPLYEGDPDDQVELMRERIRLAPVVSFQCFSGFRGSGKTTELFRLRKLLRDDGCLVFYADALEYLSPADAIDIGDMLLVIAGVPSTFISMFFTGSVLIEVIFSLNGLGLLGFEATMQRDYPVMFGTLYIFTLLGLLLTLLSDITYTLVDPRIDFETRQA